MTKQFELGIALVFTYLGAGFAWFLLWSLHDLADGLSSGWWTLGVAAIFLVEWILILRETLK